MTNVLRLPLLAFGYVVDRIRRLPGAQFVAPYVTWLVGGAFLVAFVLLLLWMAEASPQRMSLADLAAGKLSPMQSWVIVTGELQEERGSSPGAYRYRLTDPATPNAYLDVRSKVEWPLGSTTLSGKLLGGRDGVPAGYEWSAPFQADLLLADELPAPPIALVLIGLGILVLIARRTAYPMFIAETPAEVPPGWGLVNVIAHPETTTSSPRAQPATLDRDTGVGTGELRIQGSRPVPVRLHSAFTSVDVGELRGLRSSEPALRVRAADDDLTLGFSSRRERDATYARLAAGAQPGARPRPA